MVSPLLRPLRRRFPGRGESVSWLVAVVAIAAVVGQYAADPGRARVVFAGVFLLLVIGLGIRAPRPLLLALPVWLVALGLVRRLLTDVSVAGSADPLLLVGPLALIVLTFAAADRGAFRGRTPLSVLVTLYTLATCLGAVNPLQGSPLAGATALIFFVPLLAFWIGRGLADDALLRRLLLVVAALAVPAALYGMRQVFVSFPPWDRTWIASQGYTALNVGGTIRPFSTFSSSGEYATFLVVALLVWLVLGPRGLFRPVGAAAIVLIAVATFYQSSRGSIVMALAGLGVMLAARRRLPMAAAAGIGAAFLILIPVVVKQLAPKTYTAGGASALVQHQVQGLSDPLNPNASTAGAHLTLIVRGIESAYHQPLGEGIGAVTIAGAKFGGSTNATEADPSNAAVALGFPGLFLFLGILMVGFRKAYTLAARDGDRLAGVAVGILTAMALQWLNGGNYSVVFLPWLLLGWVDARTRVSPESLSSGQQAQSTA